MQKALLVLSMMGASAYAQTVVTQPQVIEAPKVVEAGQGQPTPQVYIVQNAPTATAAPAPEVRSQQVTVIEDTPLKESKADQMRKARMEIESETEQRIVEKLEAERVKAEKERAEKIAKALEGQPEVAPAPAPVPVVAQPTVQLQPIQQTPAPVYVTEPAPILEATSIKDELKEEKPVEKTKVYVSGLAGVADYPGTQKLKGIYSAGVAVGILFPDRLIAEGSVLFSNFDYEPVACWPNCYFPVIKEMDQTNFLGAIKYQIVDGRVRPIVGVLGGYTRRVYREKQYYYSTGPDITSHAFDAGVSGGADVLLSETFSAGFDLKYMFNMSYRIDNQYQGSLVNPQFEKPVEGLDYYLINFNAKLTF